MSDNEDLIGDTGDTTDAATTSFTLPQDENVSVSINHDDLPESVKNRLIATAIRGYITGSTSGAEQRWKKAGSKDGDEPDYAQIAADAKDRLLNDKMRAMSGEGGGKARTTKSPVDAIVTQAVVRDLFTKRQAKDPKTKYFDVVKEVGASGIAYLEARAITPEQQKKMRDKYIIPAQKMLGLDAKGKPTGGDEDGDDLL